MKRSVQFGSKSMGIRPSELKDRSVLSKLYPDPSNRPVKDTTPLNEATGRVNVWYVNMLIMLLITATALNTTYIIMNAKPVLGSNPLYPLNTFLFSAVMFFCWVLSLKKINMYFRKEKVSFANFMMIYLFYCLPMLQIGFALHLLDGFLVNLIIYLLGFTVLNQMLLMYLFYVMSAKSLTGGRKILLVFVPTIVMVIMSQVISLL